MARVTEAGNRKIAWVTTIANITAPTSAELTAGKDISTYVLPDSTLGQEDSDTISERSIAETAANSVVTVDHYAANLNLFRDFTALGAYETSDPLANFRPGHPVGYLVERIGLPSSTAWASAQKVSVFKVQVNSVKPQNGEGFFKATVSFVEAGAFAQDVSVAS